MKPPVLTPRIAVIHATPKSVGPTVATFAQKFPEAEIWNITDDRLLPDATANGGVDERLVERMLQLIHYCAANGASAILLACSMYQAAVASAKQHLDIPVFGSDDALFAEVVGRNPKSLFFVGPLPEAVEDSVYRLRGELSVAGKSDIKVLSAAVPEVSSAIANGDIDHALDLLSATARPHTSKVDMVVLGNFSISPAEPGLEKILELPVLSPVSMAAIKMRSMILSEA